MPLSDALSRLHKNDLQTITTRLDILRRSSQVGLRAHDNLHADHLLPATAWDSLCHALIATPANDLAIQAAIQNLFRPDPGRGHRGWTLHGPDINIPVQLRFGRAVGKATFCRELVALNYFATPKHAERAVNFMLRQPLAVIAGAWRNFRLARYSMWSTFDLSSPNAPFDGWARTARDIRACLGLDPNCRGKLILLEFTLPQGLPPKFPTVGDAYAGPVWNYYFQPAPLTAAYPLTLPWPGPHRTPRPEAIHDAVQGIQLATPLREIA